MKKKLLAYALTAADADGYYFENAPESTFCSSCSSCIRNDYYPTYLDIKNSKLDGSYTYDGQLLISKKVVDWCTKNEITGCDFIRVDTEKHLYTLKPGNTLSFDVIRREVIFDAFCGVCQQYEQIAGANPVFLKNINDEIINGFNRTDVEFGSGREKSPLIILGIDTYKKFKKERFSGFSFEPIYHYPDDFFEA